MKLRCPECASGLRLRTVSTNKPQSEVHRTYFCRSCGTEVQTSERTNAVKKPAADARAGLRSHPKHVNYEIRS